MKTYPSIPKEISIKPIYAFDKLDGSNIRAEWSKKRGFYKFGTRRKLLDPNEEVFGCAILIQERYSEHLSKIFREKRWNKAIAFFELHAPDSYISR